MRERHHRDELDIWEIEEAIRDLDPADIEAVAALVLRIEMVSTPGPWVVEWDSCDCSDGMCQHGRFPYAVTFPEPIQEPQGDRGLDYYDYQASEISSFTNNDALLLTLARTALPLLAKAILNR